MWIETAQTRLRLEPGTSTRLLGARHARLQAAAGTLWITIDQDPRDIVLGPGQSFEVDRGGDLLVCALGGPALLDLSAAAA